MLGAVFDWYSSNTKIDYPFKERQADKSHEIFVDAYVSHNKLHDKQQSVRLVSFNPLGTIELRFQDGTLLGLLTSVDNFSIKTHGVYTIYHWLRDTTLGAGFTNEYLDIAVVVDTARLALESPPITPTSGFLIDSLVNPRIKGVRKIGVALPSAACCVGFASDKVVLESGNNIELSEPSDQPNVGLNLLSPDRTRKARVIQIDVVPGSGAGRFNNCGSQDNPIRTINNQGPTPAGNFKFQGEDCTWVEQRVQTISGDTPFPFTDYRIETMLASALQLHQNCNACCDCPEYSESYAKLKDLWDRAQAVAERVRVSVGDYANIRSQVIAAPCGAASGIQLQLKVIPRPDYSLSIQAFVINNLQQQANSISLAFQITPPGWQLTPGSGRMQSEDFAGVQLDPSNSMGVAIPRISAGRFMRYSFNIRYFKNIAMRQNILSQTTCTVTTSLGSASDSVRVGLTQPIQKT